MRRIGIAASKMAKGKIWLYNFYVILISSLFSLFIFVVSGCIIVFSLIVIMYIGKELMLISEDADWKNVLFICLAALAGVIGFFQLIAIGKNLKIYLKKRKLRKIKDA